jgi:hypothetical protein
MTPVPFIPDDLEAYAAGWHGALFAPDDPRGLPADRYHWSYVPDLPLDLIEDPRSRADWVRFFDEEQSNHALDGRPGHYDGLLRGPILEPIVVVHHKERAWLWDGWHRTAACHVLGRTTIPAVCGQAIFEL